MKAIAAGVLIVSAVLLMAVIFKKRLGWGWLGLFGSHLILAAVGLYIVDFTTLAGTVYIPLNPATIGAVSVLGLPGLVMLIGLKITLFG
ncbi:inhibitor of the pro-sigma K processing machinery [Paenibacillus forsythiae]|uniref:Inhibitor of the pro-sigma K processing machinery n=1 Tax=Paenibacillus forsythiae TaxID=365616 RepID=A0ABU3HE46_9BACL|nr:pro-sigmaK processing inhibitor BofA family protein [Paenibacillus forsythiae]MDT3428990.1 inhibitor of the pro-sigma K processing machinery [Paenibacillus forsythiae]